MESDDICLSPGVRRGKTHRSLDFSMPVSRAAFIRSTVLFLLGGIAFLLLIVGTSLWLTQRSEGYFADVVAARQVRSRAADLLSLMQDAETGQRGYLLTREQGFLEPYKVATSQFETRLSQLAQAVNQSPEYKPALDALSKTLRAKLAELRRTIELFDAGHGSEALALVREGSGQRLMDDSRTAFSALIGRSEADLNASMDAQRGSIGQLRWVTIVATLAILGLAGAGAWIISRYMRELVDARLEVVALNAGLEERVRQRTDALRKANDEIQRFAYIVTHDLRAPLVNIMGFTSELDATFKPVQRYISAGDTNDASLREDASRAVEEDVPEALGFIRSSTRKMDALINAILKISREGSRVLKPERIELPALVDTIAAAVHHQASSDGGEIVTDVKLPFIVSDRLSLDQILGNLVDNAIKYRAPNRPVRVAIRARRQGRDLALIEVEDNGRGIAASDHERVFELFRRSGAQTTAGEGIGLAHVRTLVRNIGGDITLTSTLGVGTTFRIIVPLDLGAVRRSETA
jgi:signal transduction histidine kinase